MARTFQFEHFTAKTPSRRGAEAAKIHYGKRFAETEDLLQAKVMTHQLEELAGIQDSSPAPAVLPKIKKRNLAVGAPSPTDTAPIGALPPTPEQPHASRWGELLDDAEGNVRILARAVGDVARSAYLLTLMPGRAIHLAAQRMMKMEP